MKNNNETQNIDHNGIGYMSLDKKWALSFLKQAIHTSVGNSILKKKLSTYRGIDKGKINKNELKTFFDPDKSISEDQRASIMRTDWSPCPLVNSLNKIIAKNIEAIPISINVNSTDNISINKKQEAKLKIKTRSYMIALSNFIRQQLNEENIDNDVDLESHINLQNNEMSNDVSLLETMKNEISNDAEFNLLNEAGFIKDGVEIAHEQLIKFYFDKTKFSTNLAYKIISDYMKVNTFCYRFYTNTYNGKPEIQYVDIAELNKSSFMERDAKDMDYAYYEFTTTWSVYMSMVGGKLTPEQNKKVYDANKIFLFPNSTYPEYTATNSLALNDVRIRLGYFEAKKQEYDKESKKYAEVIKKFYYLPLNLDNLNEDFILDLGNLQDMYREGDNFAFADFSFIIYQNSETQSFYDIQKADYLRMNLIYNQLLNTFANFIPEGTAFVEETIRELAEEIHQEREEKMKENGGNISNLSLHNVMGDVIKNYVLSGRGIFKLRKGDRDEESLNRPTFIMENKIMSNCNQLIGLLFQVYQQMLMALGVNQNRLAQDPLPRQTASGISSATSASYYSTQDIEVAYIYAIESFANRMLYYNKQVVKEINKNGESKTERAEELKEIIGDKGKIWLEVHNDMPKQNCILSVTNTLDTEGRLRLMAQVAMYEQAGLIPFGSQIIVADIANLKLAKMYVLMLLKRQERIRLEQQQQMNLAKQQGVAEQQKNEQMNKQLDMEIQARLLAIETQLKTQAQKEIKDKIGENRLTQQAQASQLEIERKAKEKQLESL